MMTPRDNTSLLGHAGPEALLSAGMENGKMAHGWLIGGPEGIGKATLAYRFARTLLAGDEDAATNPQHPVFRRIAAGSHTDFLVVEPLYDAKKDEVARTITVEQARTIGEFLSLTPGEGKWRVVIVDSVDALNGNAANAILKILEEPPPQAVLMLISHNPGRLLPTIRSRCRMLRLAPLERESFTSVMRHVAPSLDSHELAMLAGLSGHSPGLALALHAQGAVETYTELLGMLAPLPELDGVAIHGFAERMAGSQIHTNWQVFSRLMLFLIERVTKEAAQAGMEPVSDEEGEVLNRLAQLYPASVWAAKWQQALEQFSLAERLHLDYKQITIAFIHSLASSEGFQLGNTAA